MCGKSILSFCGLIPTTVEIRQIWRNNSTAWSTLTALNQDLRTRVGFLEDNLDKHSLFKDWSVPWTRWFLAKYLLAGNEDCYIGPGGRLFYRADVDYVSGRAFLAAPEKAGEKARNPLGAIFAFRDQLAAHGIGLILFPIPVKTALDGKPCDNPSMPGFIDILHQAGIQTFYPFSELSTLRYPDKNLYLNGDTHWTPTTMRFTAEKLSTFIKERFPFTQEHHASPPAGFPLQTAKITVSNYGDLLDMLTLPQGESIIPRQKIELEAVTLADASPWRPNPAGKILLLGDSFTNIFSDRQLGWGAGAGFAEQLSLTLNQPIDVIVKNAGGSAATRQELSQEIKSGRDRLAGKTLVVWSFAARELAFGEWPLVDLTTPADRSTSPQDLRGRATVRITEVSSLPDPGGPYGDSLSVARAELPGESGQAGRTILIQGWVMRDRELLPMARWRPGATLDLNLIPWEEKTAEQPELSTWQIMNDLDDYESPMYWLEEAK